MEFISAEDFLKQDEKVQVVFLNWWEPSVGDLLGIEEEIIDRNYKNDIIYKTVAINEDDIFNSESKEELLHDFLVAYQTDRVVPLFTEGNLRQFIEDETGGILDIEYYDEKGYVMYAINNLVCIDSWGWLGHNLLQAYWKVAVEIAKENIN